MQNSFRRSHTTMVLFGPLAVAVAVATYVAGRPQVLTGAQLALADTGSGGGNTSVVVKVNGVAVTPALAAASGAASVTQYQNSNGTGTAPYPAGVYLRPGDVVTVDVTAITATPPKGGVVYLDVTQLDA